MKHLTALFEGDVQGVGFRYTAARLAQDLPITGEIRNLPDGRVELHAEGDEGALRRFLAALQLSRLGPGITHTQTTWHPATHRYPSFHIR